MMITADTTRCIVDIAFQGGTFMDQAARAHDFAAAAFRFFAKTGARNVPSIRVTENESYYIVRFEADEAGFDTAHKAAVVLNAIEAGNAATPAPAAKRTRRAR